MLGGVRMMWPGMAPLVCSGMPGSLPGDAGMPMYFRARSSMPATTYCNQHSGPARSLSQIVTHLTAIFTCPSHIGKECEYCLGPGSWKGDLTQM